MNTYAKLPALETIEAEIVRLEARVQVLMARRNRVKSWLFKDYVTRKDRAALAVARLEGSLWATSRGARALHKVYMSILNS